MHLHSCSSATSPKSFTLYKALLEAGVVSKFRGRQTLSRDSFVWCCVTVMTASLCPQVPAAHQAGQAGLAKTGGCWKPISATKERDQETQRRLAPSRLDSGRVGAPPFSSHLCPKCTHSTWHVGDILDGQHGAVFLSQRAWAPSMSRNLS